MFHLFDHFTGKTYYSGCSTSGLILIFPFSLRVVLKYIHVRACIIPIRTFLIIKPK
jgi:hypothetical protein